MKLDGVGGTGVITTVLATPRTNIRIKPGSSGTLRLHQKVPATITGGSYRPFVSITYGGNVTTIIGPSVMIEV